jgi:hypothetical protein
MNHTRGKRWVVVLGTALVFVVGLTTVAMAQTPYHLPFLRTGVGARAAGMGNAYVAVANDATAGFFNPAGLTHIQKWGFASMLSADMGLDRQFNFLAIAGSFKWGSIGASWVNAGIKDVQWSDGTSHDYLDNYFLLSYGNTAAKFRWGASLVIANNKVADKTGLGGDLGFQWCFMDEATLGLAAQSLGLKVGENRTPYNIRLGLAVMPNVLEGFTFPVEIQKTQDISAIKFRLGGEYKYKFDNSDLGAAIRGGVDDGALTLGAGVSFKQFSLDYAYVPEKVSFLGESHRFSLTGNF